MSNERSPRESCCTTMGTRGTKRNSPVAGLPHGSLSRNPSVAGGAVPVVNREVVLPVPRERAWELITEPAELQEWLGDEVEFEPVEAAPLRVAWESGEEREGVIEEVAEQERIVFRWGDSRVEWCLEDHPAGTRFQVSEQHLAGDSLHWGPRMLAAAATAALCPA